MRQKNMTKNNVPGAVLATVQGGLTGPGNIQNVSAARGPV